jgi:TonB-linked SusC/RagA family outer membrane protein
MANLVRFFKSTSVLAVFLLCSASTFSQKVIRGTVEDALGLPIIGATVYVSSDAGQGTVTDIDGQFRLTTNKPLPVSLVVKYIGYKEFQVDVYETEEPITVTLTEDNNVLDEVVVTAGGIVRAKREQGYSITKLTDKELTAGKAPSLAGGLTAKIAGLQVNAIGTGVNPNYRLVLRGNRSITGNNQALLVVDNTVVPLDYLSSINPEDVEDVQVLTGAAGAALYGSEASNGVLLVTTKKGTKGRPRIRFSNTTTFEKVNFFPQLQSRFGQGSTADAQEFDPVENQQYGPAFDGSLRDLGHPLANGDQQQVPYTASNDRLHFWDTGVNNQTDLSLSFGTDKSTSYVAAQYLTATGTTPGDKYNRISVRFNNTQDILPNLHLNYAANYVENNYDISNATSTLYEQLLNIPANVPVTSYQNLDDKYSNPEGWFNPWYRNPYWTAANYRRDAKDAYLTGKAELKWEIAPWIHVLYRAALSNRYYQDKQYTPKLTYSDYARQKQGKSNLTGLIADRGYSTYRFNQDFQIGLRKQLDDYSFNLTLGLANVNNSSKSILLRATGLVIPDLYNIGNRSGDATIPTTGDSGLTLPIPADPNSILHYRNYGGWADFVVGYKGYLFAHVTGRNDWTSLLSEKNRSYFYPSIDVSFIPTDAIEALKNITFLDYWKIRGAWSKTGNVNIGPYALKPVYNSVTGFSSGTYFRESELLVSDDLKPEITTGYEFGTEFRLLKNLVDVNFTYYNTSTTGQAIEASIAQSSGYAKYLLNTGEVTNEGIETTIGLNPVRTRDWNLHVGLNYTHNTNQLVSLHPDAKRIGVNGSSVIFAEEGYAVNQIIVPDYARDDQGRVIVDVNTGYPSKAANSVRIGNTTPEHRLGLDLSLRYKDFTLSSVFEYRGGYYYAFTAGSTLDFVGSSARTAYYNRERFVFPNSSYLDPATNTYVANTNITISDGGAGFWTNSTYNRGITSNYVYSGDYWKWREVSLSYSVPRSFIRNLTDAVQEVTISFQGRNLFLWTPKSNEYTDPDLSANDNNAIGVSTLTTTPPSRYLGGSISLTF